MILFREELPEDRDAIREVNRRAFGTDAEADLVDRLRADGDVILSLVAGEIVGHVLFSDLPIETPRRTVRGAALAPMAVLPDRQRQGIGTALVLKGVELCREIEVEAVVVLGHQTYYPRFGFSADAAKPLQAPFSGDAFMALELVPGVLAQGGRVRYAAAFGL